jgi:hypothetical protein
MTVWFQLSFINEIIFFTAFCCSYLTTWFPLSFIKEIIFFCLCLLRCLWIFENSIYIRVQIRPLLQILISSFWMSGVRSPALLKWAGVTTRSFIWAGLPNTSLFAIQQAFERIIWNEPKLVWAKQESIIHALPVSNIISIYNWYLYPHRPSLISSSFSEFLKHSHRANFRRIFYQWMIMH